MRCNIQTLYRFGMQARQQYSRNKNNPHTHRFRTPMTLCLGLVCLRVYADTPRLPQLPAASQNSTATIATNTSTTAESNHSYSFDRALFRGSALNQEALVHLSQGQSATAGNYKVDLYVNQKFFEQTNIRFIQSAPQQIEPCFSAAQLQRAAILTRPVSAQEKHSDPHSTPSSSSLLAESQRCDTLADLVGAGQSSFDIGRLRLDLSIPNSLLLQKPLGYIDPHEWQSGESIAFVNYIGHYYHSAYHFSDQTLQQDVAHIALSSGINWGTWQLRQQSTLSLQQQAQHWQNMGMFLRRPLPSIQSELTLGQLSSRGQFFSGLNFNGIQLSSDERMLPASQRGYAPVIQGIARTPAQVTIYQNNREIYQVHVAPGPFRINDLFPNSASGDLNVLVQEADGSSSSFRVPFSALPTSVRLGAFKYNFEFGQTLGVDEESIFANISSQYGLRSHITLNSGLRLAPHYQATILGAVYTHPIGAFATDLSLSRSHLAQQHQQGWLLNSSYSKSIPSTRTTLSLSAYRYSTAGYRDLVNHLQQRHTRILDHGTTTDIRIVQHSQERSRLAMSMQQMLGRYGNLYITASARYFRDQKSSDQQLQFGYSKSLSNGVSIQLNINRIMRHTLNRTAPIHATQISSPQPTANEQNQLPAADHPHEINRQPQALDLLSNKSQRQTETSFGLSVSIPLGGKHQHSKHNLMLTATHQDQHSSQYQTTLNGSLDAKDRLNYGLGFSEDSGHSKRNSYAMLQQRLRYANVGASVSIGPQYWQASGYLQGALALHRGGLTLGHYLSDTFALIEAPGAHGAQVLNTQSTVINRHGFALLPSLTPYQYNAIALNPEGMLGQAELSTGYSRVAPYAGAAIKINFQTRQGYALLIRARFSNNDAVPMGAEVFDAAGQNIGMVAQNGQIYLRSENLIGRLQIRWGDHQQDACHVDYTIQPNELSSNINKLSATCIPD